MNKFLLNDRPYTLDRIFRLIVSLIALGLFIWLVHYLRSVLIPFAIAFLLAYLLNPSVNAVQKRVQNRALALVCTLLLVALSTLALLALVVPIITKQMIATGTILQATVLEKQLPAFVLELIPAEILLNIQSIVQNTTMQSILENGDISMAVSKTIEFIAPQLFTLFSGVNLVISIISTISIVCLYVFFLLLDFDSARKEWLELLPAHYQAPTVQFLHDFNAAMSTYFRGQAIIAACAGILFAVGFSIISLPMGILIGLFIGLLNMVPYLSIAGIPIALFLGAIQAISSNQNLLTYSALILTVFVIVQIIQDLILTPRILGKSTGLSPVFILLALSIWGKLLGLLGLLLAIPMTCLLLTSYRRFLVKRSGS